MKATHNIFLVRPANFGFNAQTAASNAFQNKPTAQAGQNKKALKEFDAFAKKLKGAGINVFVFEDTASPVKPDAVFPNNWLSTHSDGTLVLYPMCAPNRRAERRKDILDRLKLNFKITNIIDFSSFEKDNVFLEGTGSIIFDHTNKTAYACLSPRTNKELFLRLAETLRYTPVCFYAHDKNGQEIYHTNVMMCVSENFALICAESVSGKKEKERVLNSLLKSGHEVIEISFEQMNKFAGNALGLKAKTGKNILALSQSAYYCLTKEQRKAIEKYSQMLPLSVPVIENIGGGSARCMIAEIFLPVA